MDFKQLPPDREGYGNAFVIADRLGKATWTTPYTIKATAKTRLAQFISDFTQMEFRLFRTQADCRAGGDCGSRRYR